MGQRNAHSLYGSTDTSSCVPDAAVKAGPAYDSDGSLVLGESFQASCPQALDGVQGQYVADVLSVWDGLADRRMENAPLLLRFEDFDVVFSVDSKGHLAIWQGSINASGAMKVAAGSVREIPENNGSCPVWMPVATLCEIIGWQATDIVEADDASALICFGEDSLHLEIMRGEIICRPASSALIL